MSIDKFERAVNEAIGSCLFFPKPTELHELAYPASNMINSIDTKGLTWPDRPLLDYMEPSEEGKKIASEMVSQFLGKLEQQDIESEKERTDRFEKNRAILKKQAKLLLQK
jgi:hypothetical protein